MESSIRFFRIRGIPVGAHWSWLFVFGLVVWSLSTSLFPATYPGLSGAAYVVMGAAAAVAFFASVLLHELGHTFVALAHGVRIRGISLWLFGGVARFETPFASPAAEARTAVAGPLVSGALALGFVAADAGLEGARAPTAVMGVVDYLARINAILFAFNLVPALPLDGGRLLHAYLWWRRRSRLAATLTAARVGRAYGIMLAVIGVLDVFTGGSTGGLWLVFLGLFVAQAAQAEAEHTRLEQALGGFPVRDLPADVRERSRAGPAVWVVVGAAMIAVAGLLYHPPYVVIVPGESFDIRGDVAITGIRTEDATGPYLLTSVRLTRTHALGTLWAAMRGDREVVAAADVVPAGLDPEAYAEWQEDVFADSRQLAAVAAAGASGLDARITGSGAEVIGVVPSAPAADALEPGDTIVAVDGRPITTAADLPRMVAARPAGSAFTLGVEREGRRVELEVRSADLPEVSGGTGLGVVVTTRDLRAILPFDISFRDRPNVGGPSAGLAYAVAIADMLDPPDDARGRAVAATGTIDAEGNVGDVGGVTEKAVAAEAAGADVFLVPRGEMSHAADAGGGLTVYGVDHLSQALQALRASG